MSYRAKDIIERVINDFRDDHNEVLIRFETMLRKEPYLDHPRYIRCILHESRGSLQSLDENIEIAKADPRDIIFNAEYEELKNGNFKQVRDFTHSFEQEKDSSD